MAKIVAPSLESRAFNCPHCDVFTSHDWYDVQVSKKDAEHLPFRISGELEDHKYLWQDLEDKEAEKQIIKKFLKKVPFTHDQDIVVYSKPLHNVSASKCYNCSQFTVWGYESIIWPVTSASIQINSDIPSEIALDMLEAASIVNISPRGAAAILRLCLQRLCHHLGGQGKNINDDVGHLVEKGLDARIQRALDIVRVVGNNAVHPGQIDIKDDRETAYQLFTLMNLVADKMITEPKQINEMYENLPEGARRAIEARDRQKL